LEQNAFVADALTEGFLVGECRVMVRSSDISKKLDVIESWLTQLTSFFQVRSRITDALRVMADSSCRAQQAGADAQLHFTYMSAI
jgi:hypothetical protein